jgi:hypothetical protein
VTPGSAIRIMPAAAINGISCLGVVSYATTQRAKREFMVILEGTDKSKRGERGRWMAPEVSKAVLTLKIINFEQGRKALEKGALEEEQSRVRLIKSIRLPGGVTLRLVGTFANDGDALRVAAGPLRRTHWFVAVLIKLIAETFVCERGGNLPRSGRF